MDSPDEWLARAEEKRRAAQKLVADKKSAREGFNLVGIAVEFAMKATIMRKHRFNRWPDASSRPDLYTHDLNALLSVLQVDHSALPIAIRVNLKVVLQWSRGHDYMPGRMPRKMSMQMYEAAFGKDGVVSWLTTL